MHTSDTAALDISQPLLVRVVKERRYAESGRWRTCSVLVFDSFTGTRIQVCEKRMRLWLNRLEQQVVLHALWDRKLDRVDFGMLASPSAAISDVDPSMSLPTIRSKELTKSSLRYAKVNFFVSLAMA
jgi:hypothetical protein